MIGTYQAVPTQWSPSGRLLWSVLRDLSSSAHLVVPIQQPLVCCLPWCVTRMSTMSPIRAGLGINSFTVPLHSPNGMQLPAVRAVQGDCHWGLKNSWNSHWSREPIMQWGTGQSQSIFRLTNHKRVMPANWRPCLIYHWQSYCHQAGTV